VDEAHGAHFGTSPLFPLSALRAGADYAAQGAHKVLGSFTQSAYLHCQGENDLGAIRDALRIVQSSSPSYLLMASLDVARCQCEQEEEQWEMAARLAGQLRQRFSQIDGITALGEELLQVPGVVEYDPSRLVINVRELGITGFDAADWLIDILPMPEGRRFCFIEGCPWVLLLLQQELMPQLFELRLISP
jgi:arginine decarboxylase